MSITLSQRNPKKKKMSITLRISAGVGVVVVLVCFLLFVNPCRWTGSLTVHMLFYGIFSNKNDEIQQTHVHFRKMPSFNCYELSIIPIDPHPFKPIRNKHAELQRSCITISHSEKAIAIIVVTDNANSLNWGKAKLLYRRGKFFNLFFCTDNSHGIILVTKRKKTTTL